MLHILFLGIPSYGHTNPTMNLVKAFIKLNYKVTYFNTSAFKSMIRTSGATFIDYNSINLNNISLKISSLPHNIVHLEIQKIFMASTAEILPHLLNVNYTNKFDIIIYDQMAIWGYVFAKIVGIPSLCSSTMLLITYGEFLSQFPHIHKSIDQVYKNYLKLITNYDREIESFQDIVDIQICSEASNVIIYSPFELQQKNSLYQSKKYIFLGNRFDSEYQPSQVVFGTKSLIYISLGTVFNEKPEVFMFLINHFSNLQNEIIISVGNNENIYNILKSKASTTNIKIHKFVNQLSVLSRASLFITHAGFNSIYEGLYFTVPMIAIPHNPEQFANAKRIVQLKAGVILNNITSLALKEALNRIMLQYAVYKKACQEMRNKILSSSNNYDAVKKITNIIK